MPDFSHVVQIRDDTVINWTLQLDYTSRFEAESAALPTRPPSILIIEGNRSGRAESHPEARVIPSDHSHAFPFFEELLQAPQPQGSQRLNTAHMHPVTPILPRQLSQAIEDEVLLQHGARGIWLQAFVDIAVGSEQLIGQLPDAWCSVSLAMIRPWPSRSPARYPCVSKMSRHRHCSWAGRFHSFLRR